MRVLGVLVDSFVSERPVIPLARGDRARLRVMARPDANLGLVGPGRFDMAPWIAAAAAITFLGLIVWCLV